MPCHTRMKRIIQGLLWLFLLEFGFRMVMSLEPGYLDFDNLPDTNFSCVGKVIGGYYADLETNCQMFHVCTIGQLDEPMDIRFLCLNGTVFDQETRVCERIDEVDCTKSEQFYSLNLELYGNTQPPILEEEIPAEIKRSTSTTTTTTTTTRPKPTTTTTRPPTRVITSHHFPVVNPSDIRFNPEEINISLNPGAPPDISKSQIPISFQHQSYNNNNEKNTRVTVTTHTTVFKNDKPHRVPLLQTQPQERPKPQITTKPKSVVNYDLTHHHGYQPATPADINYGFTYQTEENIDHRTEVPHPYQYQINIANLRPPTIHEHYYTTRRPNYPQATTFRNHPVFTSIRTSHSEEYHARTEKPPRLQLPLPLLPTLPPLTFSSPAPFTLGRHIETKRYTSDHHSPPRIIISASASVSDSSGRRLNYSLGTIGATQLIGPSPASYDDYKEEDVGLDPFYHDVPKIKSLRHKRRNKRDVDDDEVIKSEQEAADLLRYLFNWYQKRERDLISIPVPSEVITEINDELAPVAEASSTTQDDFDRLFDKPTDTSLKKVATESYPKEVATEGNLREVAHLFERTENTTHTPLVQNEIQEDDNKSTEQNEIRYTEPTTSPVVSELPHKVEPTTSRHNSDLLIETEINVVTNTAAPTESSRRRNSRRRGQASTSTTQRGRKSRGRFSSHYTASTSEAPPRSEEVFRPRNQRRNPRRRPNRPDLQRRTEETKVFIVTPTAQNVTKEEVNPVLSRTENEPFIQQHVAAEEWHKNTTEQGESNKLTVEKAATENYDVTENSWTENINSKISHLEEEIHATSTLINNSSFSEDLPSTSKEDTTKAVEPSQHDNFEDSALVGSTPVMSTLHFDDLESFNETTHTFTSTQEATSSVGSTPVMSTLHFDDLESFNETTHTFTSTQEATSSIGSTPVVPPLHFDDLESFNETTHTFTSTQEATSATEIPDTFEITTEFYPPSETNAPEDTTYISSTSEDATSTSNLEETSSVSPTEISDKNNFVSGNGDADLSDLDLNESLESTSFDYTDEELKKQNNIQASRRSFEVSHERRRGYARSRKFITHSKVAGENLEVDEAPQKYLHGKETPKFQHGIPDYVDDNYEPLTYGRNEWKERRHKEKETTTKEKEEEIATKEKEEEIATEEKEEETVAKEKEEETTTNAKEEEETTTREKEEETTTKVKEEEVASKKHKEDEETTSDKVEHTTEFVIVPEFSTLSEISEDTTVNYVTEKKTDVPTTLLDVTTESNVPTEPTYSSEPMATTETHSKESIYATHYEEENYSELDSTFPTELSSSTEVIPTEFTGSELSTTSTVGVATTTSEYHDFTELTTVTTTEDASDVTRTTSSITENLKDTNSTTESLPSTLTEPSVAETTSPSTTTPAEVKTRPLLRRNKTRRKDQERHRFSPKNRRRNGHKIKPDVLNHTVANLREETTTAANHQRDETTQHREETTSLLRTQEVSPDNKEFLTDAPLLKSANPTKAKYTRITFTTTPLSRLVRVELRKDMRGNRYTFNCFNKKIHKFYSDARDCRLFHYCTRGYTKNQLVDMKFVCDAGTYFDDVKLICTKEKPARCL